MKPREVDYLFIGTGIAPLLAAFRLRTTDASFFLLNPLPDYFQENLDLGFDPEWPLDAREEALPYEAEAKLLEEFYPGSLARLNAADPAPPKDANATGFFQRNRLFLRGEDPALWNAVEAAFVARYDRLKPQTLSDAQAAWLFPGVNARLSRAADDAAPVVDLGAYANAPSAAANSVLFPRTGVLDFGPYRNGLYAFLRENHPDEIQVGAEPIVVHPGWVQYRTARGPATVAVRKGAVIFASPAIASWLKSLARTLEVEPEPRPARRLLEEYRIVSKEPIDAGTIGTRDRFTSWSDFRSDAPGSARSAPFDSPILRVLRAVPSAAAATPATPFTEESFLDLKKWITGFLAWDDFRIRGMRARSYAEASEENAGERWETEHLRIDVRYACDGPVLRSIREVKRWLAGEGLA